MLQMATVVELILCVCDWKKPNERDRERGERHRERDGKERKRADTAGPTEFML